MEWYEKAAQLGHASAMCCLGFCYKDGVGVPKDEEKAAELFQQAAEQEDPDAMCTLGWCCETGCGVPQDWGQAAEWYRKAADAGSGQAMGNLAWCYEHGKGVELDLDEACRWYRRGAEAGDQRSASQLERWQYQLGTQLEPERAADRCRQEAEGGDPAAMHRLALRYETGDGVPQDWPQAVHWHRRAAGRGYAAGAGRPLVSEGGRGRRPAGHGPLGPVLPGGEWNGPKPGGGRPLVPLRRRGGGRCRHVLPGPVL